VQAMDNNQHLDGKMQNGNINYQQTAEITDRKYE
jgi:hypothetical protein